MASTRGDNELTHVLDLPQLYQRPTAESLIRVLDLLATVPPSFDSAEQSQPKVSPEGVADYLTRIVGSPLSWLQSDDEREQIWNVASVRLAERSGRTGMGAIDRVFRVPWPGNGKTFLDLQIHEPALVEDNLGLKTWGSSFALAKHLVNLEAHFADLLHSDSTCSRSVASQDTFHALPRVLELGAGTGVLGLAFAAVFRTDVLMTDLPEIAPNLARNAKLNAESLQSMSNADTKVGILDWSVPENVRLFSLSAADTDEQTDTLAAAKNSYSFDLVLAADPIYSPHHPGMLTDAIKYHLSLSPRAKVLVAYPLRVEYQPQIDELSELMGRKCGLKLQTTARIKAADDWQTDDELMVEYKIFGRLEDRD